MTLGRPLAGKGVALYFEKPSLRTRHSCEMATVQLGGHPVTIKRDEIDPGARESWSDIACVLAGYHAVMGARVFEHDARARRSPSRMPCRSSTCCPTTRIRARRSPTCSPCVSNRAASAADRLLRRRLQQRRPLVVARRRDVGHERASRVSTRLRSDRRGPRPARRSRLRSVRDDASGRGRQGRRRGAHRRVDVDGLRGRERTPFARLRRLPGRRPGDGGGRSTCDLHALPSGAPGRGGSRVGGRRPAEPHLRAGAQPHAQLPRPARRGSSRSTVDEESTAPSNNGAPRLAKQQRQHRIARLLEQHAVSEPGPAHRTARRRRRDRDAGDGVARPRGAERDQGARRRRRQRLRHPGAAEGATDARGPSAARAGRLGGRGGALAQPRRAAHAARVRPRRRRRPSTGPA